MHSGQELEKKLRSILKTTQIALKRLTVEIWTFKKADGGSEGSDEHSIENIYHLREFLNHCELTVDRYTDLKGVARTQIEMRNMLLETVGEVSFLFSGRKLG